MIKITDLKVGNCLKFINEYWILLRIRNSPSIPTCFQVTWLSEKGIVSNSGPIHLDFIFSNECFLIC
jgi:hypothetical protein